MIWQAPWWVWVAALAAVGIGMLICWLLMPQFLTIGAVTFCLLAPGCHFQ